MEKWGLFVTKDELDETMELIKQIGLEVFEVRKLTFVEKLTYVGNDLRLFLNSPHVIMFNATKEAYNNFIKCHNFTSVF